MDVVCGIIFLQLICMLLLHIVKYLLINIIKQTNNTYKFIYMYIIYKDIKFSLNGPICHRTIDYSQIIVWGEIVATVFIHI